MFNKIKQSIEKELPLFLNKLKSSYPIYKISPLLFNSIEEYVLRPGKRVRPTLFIIGYLGYSRRKATNLYTSALALELLHDFMLVHDDIIDRSSLRRGKPSMHTLLNKNLQKNRLAKFNGEDLAIIIGDVMYAIALHAFLEVKESPANKEAAFKKLIEAAYFTGTGEFIELLYGAKELQKIKQVDIYRIYDLKTAYYTFSFPLTIGATLAGADPKQIRMLFSYGAFLGRAFQIKDDILGMFGEKKEIGKSILTDLKEGKRTLLIWHAFNNCNASERAKLKKLLGKKDAALKDLQCLRKIIVSAGSLDYAKNKITALLYQAKKIYPKLSMSEKYKKSLRLFTNDILRT